MLQGCSSPSADCRFVTFAHVLTCWPPAAAGRAAVVRPAAVAGGFAAAGQFAVDVAEPNLYGPNAVCVSEVCTLYVLWVVLYAVVADVAVVVDVVVVVVVVDDTANFDLLCTDGADDGQFPSASFVVAVAVVVVVVVDNTAAE